MGCISEFLADLGMGFLLLLVVGFVMALVLTVRAALKDIDNENS